jgi:hypothetical protein
MFGKGGMGNLMKQAQMMQERMAKMQEEIARMEVTGESGAGLVKVTMTGSHNVRKVDIDPSLLEDDKEMLEDLIAASCGRKPERKNGASDWWYAITARHEIAILMRVTD